MKTNQTKPTTTKNNNKEINKIINWILYMWIANSTFVSPVFHISYNHDNVHAFHFRDDGAANIPISLPTDNPFILVRYKGKCQAVYGINVLDLHIRWDDDDVFNQSDAGGAHPDDGEGGGNHLLHFCYYANRTINVGGVEVAIVGKWKKKSQIVNFLSFCLNFLFQH